MTPAATDQDTEQDTERSLPSTPSPTEPDALAVALGGTVFAMNPEDWAEAVAEFLDKASTEWIVQVIQDVARLVRRWHHLPVAARANAMWLVTQATLELAQRAERATTALAQIRDTASTALSV